MSALGTFAIYLRQRGRAIEPGIWDNWGGAPSVRFLRWRDQTLAPESKSKLHNAIREHFGISMPSKEAEEENPEAADALYEQGFRHVRTYLRQIDNEGPWAKHNADYGSVRNLLGGVWAWRFTALVGLAGCLFLLYQNEWKPVPLYVATVLCFAEGLFAFVGLAMLREALKDNAERYAEVALVSFMSMGLDRNYPRRGGPSCR